MQRRAFIRTGAAFVAGLLADQIAERLVIDPAIETAEALAGAGPRDPFVATDFIALFEQHAAPRQLAALAAWRDGRNVVAELPALDPDGMHAVIAFDGPRARYEVFGRGLSVLPAGDVVGRPIIAEPDPAYGRFVHNRAATCYAAQRWTFDSCFGRVAGRTEPVRYLSLMLPIGDRVVSVGFPSTEWPPAARRASGRPGATPSPLRTGATI